ncbi:MAG: DUF1698 domain-containing protein [Myxococcota bacterium]
MSDGLDPKTIRERVDAVPLWWHSVEVGQGIHTPGNKTPELLDAELANLQLPDLQGKRVLDIGAWDGFFSFSCERLGAAEVVALDHHVWSMDIPAYSAYRDERIAAGERIQPPEELPVWQPDRLPGKAGFDTAAELRGSKVNSVVADFMDTDLAALGSFDVVLYLGVLYHMEHPFLALQRLAQVTREVAIIETEATRIPGFPDASMALFHPFNELNDDPTNWWVPTLRCLSDMCRAAGFSRVQATTKVPKDRSLWSWRRRKRGRTPRNYRLVVQAWK